MTVVGVTDFLTFAEAASGIYDGPGAGFADVDHT